MKEAELKRRLAQRLSGKRMQHVCGVAETAERLAKRFGISPKQARLAGLLHDCAREHAKKDLLEIAAARNLPLTAVERGAPVLLHAPVGALWAKELYGVEDAQVLRAIALHTTGGAAMTELDKIIYLADMIEPGRDFPGVTALRRTAETDLDKAVFEALGHSLAYMLKRGDLIHPDTVIARNEILLKD